MARRRQSVNVERAATAIGLGKELMPAFIAQRKHALEMDKWTRGRPPKPAMPAEATTEYVELQERSPTPWLGLTVSSLAQAMIADGFRGKNQVDNSPVWNQLWEPNRLGGRQNPVYRGALTHGLSFVTAFPGFDPITGDAMSVLKGKSAKRMAAFYHDEGEDDFPYVALDARLEEYTDDQGNDARRWRIQLIDDEGTAHLVCDATDVDKGWEFISFEPHPAGVCPVVRFANTLDLDGEVVGEVAPFIPLASRIDQDTFDRLVVQRFGAWKVRWIAGMAKPKTDAERRAASIKLRQEDLLVSANENTKFGTFEATSLEGFIRSRDADIRDLAAVTQTPPHHLLGLSPNLSAEALAAAESALMRKVDERKTNFGESWELALRLGAHIAGDREAARDFSSQILWRDVESRSLSQVADALGKIAAQLHVPFEMLWERIPGWTTQDTEKAKKLLEQQGADAIIEEALAALEAQGQQAASTGTAAQNGQSSARVPA